MNLTAIIKIFISTAAKIAIIVATTLSTQSHAQITEIYDEAVYSVQRAELRGFFELEQGRHAIVADTLNSPAGMIYRLNQQGTESGSTSFSFHPSRTKQTTSEEVFISGFLSGDPRLLRIDIENMSITYYPIAAGVLDINKWNTDYVLATYNPDAVIRLNSNGEVLWSTPINQTVGPIFAITEYGQIVAPSTNNEDFFLFRILLDGTIIQSDTLTDYGTLWSNRVSLLPQGDILIGGRNGVDADAVAITQLSPNGNLVDAWGDGAAYGSDFLLLPDGGTIVAGATADGGPNETFHIQRYDAGHELLWDVEYAYDDQQSVYTMTDTHMLLADNGDLVMAGTHFYYGGGDNWDLPRPYIARFALDPTVQEIRANALPAWVDTTVVQPGGGFVWRGELRNHDGAPHTTDVWVIARGPNGYPSQPFRVWEDVEIPADGVFQAYFSQFIPEDTPPGRYNYIVRMGDASTLTPRFQAHFPFRVIGDVPPLRPRGGVPGAGLEPVVPQLPPPERTDSAAADLTQP